MASIIKRDLKHAINKLMRAHKRFPTIYEICEEFNFTHEQAKKCMNALAEDGYLEEKGNWYGFKNRDPEEKEIKQSIQNPTKPEDKDKWKEKVKKEWQEYQKDIKENGKKYFGSKLKKIIKLPESDSVSSVAVYVIRLSMLLVGMGSISISIYYNTLWALEFLPKGLAIVAGCIFVLFSVVAFEAVLLFISYKKIKQWRRTASIIGLVLLWITAAMYSVTSTVHGRYQRYTELRQTQGDSIRKIKFGRLKWDNLQKRKNEILRQIKYKRGQIIQFNKIARGISSVKDRERHGVVFLDTQFRIRITEANISKLEKKLELLRKQEENEIEKSPIIIDRGKYSDFYEWLSTIFNKTKEQIHFFLSLFPAFFFDVISPVAIALFLFLKKE